jgi:predicted dinucleotide-binding enzyme
MKIGIIGAGNIGANAAKLFIKAGHQIAVANSRGAETLKDLVTELGYKTLPADAFDGKIVVDSNNYYPDRDGNFAELDENKTTSSEMLAEHLKGARIVKGFNTIWFEHLKTQGDLNLPIEERRAIFIAGDDTEAKKVVAQLVEEIGFAAVDTGDLRYGGAAQQPETAIYNRNLTAHEAEAVLGSEGGY